MPDARCPDCGHELDDQGRCSNCEETLDAAAEVFKATVMGLDALIAAIEAAPGIDEIMDVLARATPPFDKLEQQRYRERLLRAMRGKVSAASKIVDAWLGTGEQDDDAVTAGQASELVQLVQQRDATLFHTPDQTAFVALTVDGHREVHPIRSRSFKLWLARAYWEWTAADAAAPAADAGDDENPELMGALAALFKAAKPRVPKAQAITDAIATLEGIAIFDGDEHAVHVRLAHFGEHVYLDLGNEQWEAVEITATGWSVVARSPVMFRRPPGLEALPHPVPGGTITELRKFLNVDAAGWVLLIGYIVGLFSPGPYPVLVLLGEMGSAKSTVSKVVRRVIDPNTALLRRKPRSDHDLAIAANNGWVVTCDNLSSLPVWLSDAICTLATGGGFATRLLYSDTDEQLFDSMRPVVLNGIGDIAARSDLLDRALLLICPAITKKVPEREFWAAFELALPRILGAILDAVVAAVHNIHDVVLDETPRMVDFAAWVTAAEPALGLETGTFLAAYLANRTAADQTALEGSPIGHYISQLGEWSGTATELLAVLNEMANETDKITDADKIGPTRRQEGWPKAANALSGKLHLLAPNLRRIGVDIAIGHTERGSKITISPRVTSDANDRQDRQDRQPHDPPDDPDGPGDDLHRSPDATAPTQPDTTCEICGARGRPYLNHVLCDAHKDDLR